METEKINLEKEMMKPETASELNEEILCLDTKNLEVRDGINKLKTEVQDIETIVESGVSGDETFKNERARKSEITERLKSDKDYLGLKEKINVWEFQVKGRENRKKFLEREMKIVLAQDRDLGKELTEVSLNIRKGDKKRAEGQERLEQIKLEQQKEQKNLSKAVVKTSEEFRKAGENKIKELGKEINKMEVNNNRDVADLKKKEDELKNTPVERTKEEIDKQFRELINNNELLKKLAKEIETIQKELQESMIDREYYQRKIFIKAIERGIRV